MYRYSLDTVEAVCQSSLQNCHQARRVVAAVVTNGPDLALFKRSFKVSGGCGLWHCITGFLEPGVHARQQVVEEIYEESSLSPDCLNLIKARDLSLSDAQGNAWQVHAFHYESNSREFQINWESDDAQWFPMTQLRDLATVPWLADVISGLHLHAVMKNRLFC